MHRWLIVLLLVVFADLAPRANGAEPVSFKNDVMAVLSKAGCNMGTCHGNLNGKNGFKLSLRGQDPGQDFDALTRDQLGRRINRQSPDASLVLQKATGVVPHVGGTRFRAHGLEHDLLHRWIVEGARFDAQFVPSVVAIDVTPSERIAFAPGESVQLAVGARFADGKQRNVTRLATYEPSSLAIAVSPEGEVRRVDGQTDQIVQASVLVRFLDKQSVVRLAFVPEHGESRWPDLKPVNYVDMQVFSRLQALRIEPSTVCADHVFLRRVHLDLLGALPTAEEARAFLDDADPDKRERLVDRVLARPAFADFWALKWSDLLRNEEKALDSKGVRAFQGWLRQQVVDNVPLNELARTIVAARGSTYDHPAANFYRALRDNQSRTEAVGQVFLGIRLQCAKCHNHPFDQWTQDDYHGLSAFFARVKYQIVENNRKDRFDQHEFDGEQVVWQSRDGEARHPRQGKAVEPRFLANAQTVDSSADRLQALADWIADPANPFFARAQANRIWYHLLGRGIVDPIDDFRTSNPASNPELLDALAKDFTEHGFDLRHLVHTILRSRTYQLASAPTPSKRTDEVNFSHVEVRRLQAEQLLDSLAQILESPLRFTGYPAGTRAVQLAGAVVPGRRRGGASRAMAGPAEADLEGFLRTFGKPDRLLTCECERSDEPTVMQAFRFIAGEPTHGMLIAPDNRLGRLLKANASDAAMLDEFYLAALSRFPSDAERDGLLALLKRRANRRIAWEDVLWGLLNSKEFLLRQ